MAAEAAACSRHPLPRAGQHTWHTCTAQQQPRRSGARSVLGRDVGRGDRPAGGACAWQEAEARGFQPGRKAKGALASRSGVGLSSGTHCPSPNACRRCSWPRSRRTARKMRGRAAASASRSSTRRSCRKSPRRGRVDPQDCHAQPRPAREEARPLTLARAAESRVSLRAGELGGGEGGARYSSTRGRGAGGEEPH